MNIMLLFKRMAQQSEKAIRYLATLEQYHIADVASREDEEGLQTVAEK